MSMPTSDTLRAAAPAAAFLFLGACQIALPDGGLSRLMGGPSGAAETTVARGAVTVAGPSGYCIDRALSRPQSTDPFIALLPCPGADQGPAVPPLILTATVGAPSDLPPADVLAVALAAPSGRAAMARTGDAATVTVHDTVISDETVFLHLRDVAAAEGGPAVEPDYWRAVLSVAGRPVTLTAMSPAGLPVPPDAALDRLATFATLMRNRNLPPDATAAPRAAVRS